MTSHAAAGKAATADIAGQVRAELARHRKTATDLAAVLEIGAHTAGRRLNGDVPFNADELVRIGLWLGLSPTVFFANASSKASA